MVEIRVELLELMELLELLTPEVAEAPVVMRIAVLMVMLEPVDLVW